MLSAKDQIIYDAEITLSEAVVWLLMWVIPIFGLSTWATYWDTHPIVYYLLWGVNVLSTIALCILILMLVASRITMKRLMRNSKVGAHE